MLRIKTKGVFIISCMRLTRRFQIQSISSDRTKKPTTTRAKFTETQTGPIHTISLRKADVETKNSDTKMKHRFCRS